MARLLDWFYGALGALGALFGPSQARDVQPVAAFEGKVVQYTADPP